LQLNEIAPDIRRDHRMIETSSDFRAERSVTASVIGDMLAA
jgi:hypothetical protein